MNAALPYDYAHIETLVSGFVPQWRALGYDVVVAIARGGLFPGLIASTELSLPLHALAYARNTRKVSWYTVDQPSPAAKILLIEDIAGRGNTLVDCLDFLQAQGHQVDVFALAYDAQSRIKPDFGIEVPSGLRAWFPWERTSITEAFSETDNEPTRPEHDYASWAIDLDGILLMDLPEDSYAQALHETLAQRDLLLPNAVLPGLHLENITIITGRPEQDRSRTQAWLQQHGFHGPLIMRDETRYTPAQTSQHKAEALMARCHTHFIESDPVQALDIAYRAKVARVIWWNGGKALRVHASDASRLDLA